MVFINAILCYTGCYDETWNKKITHLYSVWGNRHCRIGDCIPMKKTAIALCILSFLCCLSAGCAQQPLQSESFAMNTFVQQTVYTQDETILAQNNATLRTLENELSKTLPGSDVWNLNHSQGTPVAVSADTVTVLLASLAAGRETNGAFNPALGALRDAWSFGSEQPRVPSAQEINTALKTTDDSQISIEGTVVSPGNTILDFGGAAKGYALDLLKENLEAANVSSALISVGGSIYARGTRPDGKKWSVGLRSPSGGVSNYFGTVRLENTCISTSGIYAQGFTQDGVYYHHLLDPKTGYPANNGLAAVSVIHPSGMITDLYSTALFVMGLEGGLAFANANDMDAIFITTEQEVVLTNGFDYDFTIKDAAYHEK